MEKRSFLKALGLVGIAPLAATREVLASTESTNSTTACVLIPSETAGPFPLDLTENSTFFRSDIREGKTGALFKVKMRIIGIGNCEPMQNVRVNIWHCDKDGLYSGYSQTNNPGQAGLTYLRGYQFTDANGEVEFTTIFPGWYTGRICHIHFQVHVSTSYSAVSQMTFDPATKNALYSANSALYTKGSDPMTLASDNIFSDGYTYQLATLTAASSGDGYETYLEVGVQGNGVTGVGHLEKETAKHLKMGQNFPNPYQDSTTIPFQLTSLSDVRLELFDQQGRRVASIKREGLEAGDHSIEFRPSNWGLSAASYVYQMEVINAFGTYRDVKRMTVLP